MGQPQTVAFIFARGGSKGLPGKNIKELGGKPLIAHSIEAGFATPGIDRVIVSTNDASIAKVAKSHGAAVPFMRPSELAGDSSAEWLAWRHAIETVNAQSPENPIGTFISLPCTAPLRNVEDITNCLKRFKVGDVDVVITIREAERSPYFNMVSVNEKGLAQIAIKTGHSFHRRQDVPEIFDMTTVAYVCKPEFILKSNSLFEGKVGAVMIPKERAIDIDTQLDFDMASFLLTRSET
jgi:N-acylneuraminate cytidylyltransferase